MTRRTAAFSLALGVLLAPLAADAQQPGRVYRIGNLIQSNPSVAAPFLEAFTQGLREFGYIEGKNIAFERRWADNNVDKLPDLAAELVREKVDLIMVATVPAALATKRATTTVPIVMAGIPDPVALGLVASLARPRGNVTGVAFDVGPEVIGKTLQLLKEAVPKISRVAVLWNPDSPALTAYWKELRSAAQTLRIGLESVEVRASGDFDSAFSAMTRARVDALMVMPDPLVYSHRRRIVDFAGKSRLPSTYALREFVDEGGLIFYGASYLAAFRRVGYYIDKILKGAKPADLPVEQPTKFELIINLKTAKALGLTIPQSVLIRADEVIQ